MRFTHDQENLVLLKLLGVALVGLVTDDSSQLLRNGDEGKTCQVVNSSQIALVGFRRRAWLDLRVLAFMMISVH
jgi:hypothetical protein